MAFNKSLIAAALTVCALPFSASASLVYDSSILAPAQGFGTAPRHLSLQATGQATFESGAVSYSAAGISFGTPIADALVYDGNGITNASGTATMPSPLGDNQKYGVPTTGSLGITSASQIGVLFNATEPSGDPITVQDVTLKFYTSAGSFLGAIDGSYSFADSNAGNGVAGYTFTVSADEQDYVNGLLAAGGSGTTLALEATLSAGSFSGGPETFLVYNIGSVAAVPEPGTYALMLAGLGVMGWVARRTKRAQA